MKYVLCTYCAVLLNQSTCKMIHQMFKKGAKYLMLLSHKRLFQVPCRLLAKKSAVIVNPVSNKVETNLVS
jgi:hypothetical protein